MAKVVVGSGEGGLDRRNLTTVDCLGLVRHEPGEIGRGWTKAEW